MSFSSRSHSKAYRASVRVVVTLIIASLAVALSPVQAEVAGAYARQALRLAFASKETTIAHKLSGQDQNFAAERADDPSQNASRVTHFRLCPRHLVLYVGEAYTLVPVPLDRNEEIVNAVASSWNTNDLNVATVSSWGEVGAIAAGHAVVTVQAGTGRATVSVEVREGGRRRQSDLEYDLEHAGDCNNPEAGSSPKTKVRSAATTRLGMRTPCRIPPA